MKITTSDVNRFANWSGDRNPLHVDPEFGRRTFFGGTVVHGVLAAIHAMAERPYSIEPAETLDIEFRNAVYPDRDYEVDLDESQAVVTVRDAEGTRLVIRRGPPATPVTDDLSWVRLLTSEKTLGLRTEPAPRDLQELEHGITLTGIYGGGTSPEAHLGETNVRTIQARVLGLCSYLVGMEVPGLRSLFTHLRIQFYRTSTTASDQPLAYRLTTKSLAREFRMLRMEAAIVSFSGDAIATAKISAYVPFSPTLTEIDALDRHIGPKGAPLTGKVALVCGGSRGLGADLAASLALAGCHVYASSRSDTREAAELAKSLKARGATLELIRGDAADIHWCRATREMIQERHRRLDYLVLNACEPPKDLKIGPGATAEFRRYINDNLQLVQNPLVELLPSIDQAEGTVVAISSSWVTEPPPYWAHYVALKHAVEGLVISSAQEYRKASYLIPRPGRLRTTWNDTPTGVAGASPSWYVAATVLDRLVEGIEPGRVDILSSFPDLEEVAVCEPETREPQFSVAVCATFTLDPILPAFQFWFRDLGLPASISTAPYGQLVQELLNPTSLLRTNSRGVNVILLCVIDWLRELPTETKNLPDAVQAHLHDVTEELIRATRTFGANANVNALLIICPSRHGSEWLDDIIESFETRIGSEIGAIPGMTVIRAHDYSENYRVDIGKIHDPLRDELGHIPYTDDYYNILATLALRHLYRGLLPMRKVVVVDCDNTLWQGVVGEDGWEGISILAAHKALHSTLMKLSRSGILICLCSKNVESDVWQVFERRSDIGLQRSQIVAATINWLPKSENLHTLASRLNLGLDSFLFIDDNPVECAEVRSRCPEVLTLQWPTDDERAHKLLAHTWEFDVTEGTEVDRRRTQLYREEYSRKEQLESMLSFADFIEGLGLQIEVSPITEDSLARASQMTMRTNQFNFTTIRRNEREIQALVDSADHICRVIRVRDRFGDYGIVGLLILKRGDDRIVVDTFLLSCRVLGRGVEHRMAAEIGREAIQHGAPNVDMRVDATKKNRPAWQFLQEIAERQHLYLLQEADDRLVCAFPADVLSRTEFSPVQESQHKKEHKRDGGDAIATGGESTRRREQQIVRAAFDLSTSSDLQNHISQPSKEAVRAPSTLDNNFIRRRVLAAFADALDISTGVVEEVDQLEALGCDSLKIVGITVELIEDFPWLPTTLLFEHRSVSDIINHIERISAESGRGSTSAADRTRQPETAGASLGNEDIAVVGIDVRCAGADSARELWNLLSSGDSAVRRVPKKRGCFLGRLNDGREHWAGLMEGLDAFDAEFFGVAPREAQSMDPQLRLLLEVAWGAAEDAGAVGTEQDANTGVFVGVMYGDYVSVANSIAAPAGSPYRSWEGFSLANRLSQIMGYDGPSIAVDTACSSSATALHLACRSLQAGDCRAALVAGVNLILDPNRFVQLGRLGILSETGECRPFGVQANGTVLGEGVVAVVLRPLTDALARKERIYGIIKATGLSTGAGTVGFTAPNPQAQSSAIRRCLDASGVDSRTISYIETHGTGTSLGDPIEVRGLTLAYCDHTRHQRELEGRQQCSLGSIKPNVGHLEAGAGLIGLIKVLLQLEHGMLVPSLTSPERNPQIPFDETPFVVQSTLETWNRPIFRSNGNDEYVPRRAGISSFGVGGANVHIIVEEPPEPVRRAPASDERPFDLLVLSARSGKALETQAKNFAHWLDARPDLPLHDLCYSAATRRKHFEHRLAVAAQGRDELIRALDTIGSSQATNVSKGKLTGGSTRGKVAFLFTGQGSQYVGMGKALYEAHPVYREAFDRCSKLLEPQLGRPLAEIVFASSATHEADLLNQTRHTQPALFALQYALAELWISWGVKPDVVLGHSVGEFAALCVAGGMSVESGVALIEARGRIMQALPPGGVMVSVRASEDRLRPLVDEHADAVAIAGVNSPDQVVLSGAEATVEEIVAQLQADGVRTTPLAVSHAFHSPLLKPIRSEFGVAAAKPVYEPTRVPFVSSVNGQVVDVQVGDYWVNQALSPVRFMQGMNTLHELGVDTFIEIGPQPVLLGMGRACLPTANVNWLPSLQRDANPWSTMLKSIGDLYVGGYDGIDWEGFERPYIRQFVSLPTYPFVRKSFWIDSTTIPGLEIPSLQDEKKAEQCLYEIDWQEQTLAEKPTENSDGACWLIFADAGGVGTALAKQLEAEGKTAVTLITGESYWVSDDRRRFRIDPRSLDHWTRMWTEVTKVHEAIPGIVSLCALDEVTEGWDARVLDKAIRTTLEIAIALVQSVTGMGDNQTPRIWFVTREAAPIEADSAGSTSSMIQSALWGFGRTLALEHSGNWGGIIDLGPSSDPSGECVLIAKEIESPDSDDQVGYRAGRRYVPRLRPAKSRIQPGEFYPAEDGTYLVTGGLGALGKQTTRWLIDKGAKHLVLIGRRGPNTPGAESFVEECKAEGVDLSVVAADVANSDDVDRVITNLDPSFPLRGVVHAAGVDEQIEIKQICASDVERVLSPKVKGALLLHEKTQHLALDLFLCFSSIASILGTPGRAHYGAANAVLDALSNQRRREGLTALSVNWGPWKGGGMASDAELKHYDQIGNHGLAEQTAFNALDRALSIGTAQSMVADIDWPRFRPIYEARRPRGLLSALPSSSTQRETDIGTGDLADLEGLTAVDRTERIERLLQETTSSLLGFGSPDEVDKERSFFDMGMDSLTAVTFTTELNSRFGIDGAALVFSFPSINSLARYLVKALASAKATETQHSGTENSGNLPNLIRDAVSKVLGFDDANAVPLDQNLFDMGMDSLSAVQLATRLAEHGIVTEPALIFDHPSIAELVECIMVSSTPEESTESTMTGEEDALVQSGVVPYSVALEPQIQRFQQLAWPNRPKTQVDSYWRWAFIKSAERLGSAPSMWLYQDADTVVGETGAVGVKFKLGTETLDTAWFVDSMVLDPYQSQAVGTQILLQAMKDIPFALTLGQTEYMRTILLAAGWRRIGTLAHFVYPLRPLEVLRGKIPGGPIRWTAAGMLNTAMRVKRLARRPTVRLQPVVSTVSRFGIEHDELWSSVSREITCGMVRDSSFLNWKYVDQPGIDYHRLEIRRQDEVSAVLILSTQEPNQVYRYRRACIVDAIVRPSDTEMIWVALDSARDFCNEREVDAIHFYASCAALQGQATSFGFVQRESQHVLLATTSGLTESQVQILTNIDNWYCTMGDSDLDHCLRDYDLPEFKESSSDFAEIA